MGWFWLLELDTEQVLAWLKSLRNQTGSRWYFSPLPPSLLLVPFGSQLLQSDSKCQKTVTGNQSHSPPSTIEIHSSERLQLPPVEPLRDSQ